jgi:hypothetical protein
VTTDERFERIEHVTAGLAEQFRKDREENRQLWRETQRQIDQFVAESRAAAAESRASDERLKQRIEELAAEGRAEDQRLEKRIDQLAAEARAEDKRLGERIEALVIAMGEYIASQKRERQ